MDQDGTSFILNREVELFYRNERLWHMISVVNASFLCGVAYYLSQNPSSYLFGLILWWTANTLIAVGCMAVVACYHRQSKADRYVQARGWRTKARVGAVVSGLAWSCGVLIIIGSGGSILDLFMTFVSACMIAGAIPAFSADRLAYRCYTYPILTVLVLRLITNDLLGIAFVIVIVLFMVIATRSAGFLHQTLQETLQLEFEKSALIADLREAKQVAEGLYKARTEFLANISHELRTPMNGIIGMVDLLSLDQLSEEQLCYVKTLRSSSDQLLDLINRIVELAALDSGRIKFNPTPFSINEWVLSVKSKFNHHALSKELSFAIEKPDDLPLLVIGAPDLLNSVIKYLLENAVKFTDSGGICLLLQIIGRSQSSIDLRFVVMDTGRGIAADKIQLISGLLVQEDGSATRRYGGIGLGLPIARKLIELMGGELSIESEVGKGSHFSFVLTFDLAEIPLVTADTL